MKRNLKVLGLALVAVFALSAMSASAASAQNGVITDTEPFWLHGEDEPPPAPTALTAFEGTTECAKATYEGGKVFEGEETPAPGHHEALTSGAGSFTLTPTYEECLSNGVFPETITMNGCDYVINIGETVPGSENEYNVTADLVCPEVDGVTQEVTIDIYLEAPPHSDPPDCVIHIPEQKGLKGGMLTDEPTSGHLTLTGVIKPIKMTLTAGPCSEGQEVPEANGELDLAVTLEGRSAPTGGGNPVSLSLSHL